MLHLQARQIADERVIAQLEEAAGRIIAVARAHELLYQSLDVEWLDIGKYIERICKSFDTSISHCTINTSTDYGIEIATDRAISCALLVNELVSNAAKYAYPERSGVIWVVLVHAGDKGFSISVRDEGVGLPPDFDPAQANGLGMRLIAAFIQQLDGAFEIRRGNPGTEFVVSVPTDHPTTNTSSVVAPT
jgi:two-component sensor histidine kinase